MAAVVRLDQAALELDPADGHVRRLDEQVRAVREPQVLDHRTGGRHRHIGRAGLGRLPARRYAGARRAREAWVTRGPADSSPYGPRSDRCSRHRRCRACAGSCADDTRGGCSARRDQDRLAGASRGRDPVPLLPLVGETVRGRDRSRESREFDDRQHPTRHPKPPVSRPRAATLSPFSTVAAARRVELEAGDCTPL